MKDVKISICMVTYNCKSVVENTLLNIINQNYENKEIVVIDGNSTDGTLELLYNYDKKIQVLISEPDYGIYDAMNKALNNTSGDWICFMNAGDMFYDLHVLTQVSAYAIDSKCDIMYGATKVLERHCEYIRIPGPIESISNGMPFCHQSTFVRASKIKEYGFDLKYRICADYNLFYSMYRDGCHFQYIPVIVAVYDQQDGGYSKNNIKRCLYESLMVRKGNGINLIISYFLESLRVKYIGAKTLIIGKKKQLNRYIQALQNDSQVKDLFVK